MNNPIVSIIMGSDSDLPIMKDAAEMLDHFGISYECTIVSAHRTPERMFNFAKSAASRGIKVIIAGAGGAAHLPGMMASITHLPVIGVPIKSKSLDGIDSLYSIVQMPSGVPVATVSINGATNAGILAAQMIGISDENIRKSLIVYKESLNKLIEKKAERLEKAGWENY